MAHDHADDSQRGGDVVRRSLKCFAINLSTFQRISFPHLPWDGIRIGFKRHYFRTSAHLPKKSCVRKGHGTSCVLLHSIPRAKCGTKAERVWNKHSASVRSKVRFAPLPEIRNRSFSTISQCVHSAKSCILSNYTSHEKLDFRHPYFPSFSDSGATAHSVIFRKLPMCTFRQKLRPK